MSRLDYVTVGIVAVCLAALGFLVFKTVGLMNGNAETETQPTAEYVDPYPIDSTTNDTSGFTDPAYSYTDEDPDDAEVTTYSEEDDKNRDIVSDRKTTDNKTATKSTAETAKKKENVKPEATKSETTAKGAAETDKTVSTAKAPTKSSPKATTPARTTDKEAEPAGTYAVQAGAFKARANAESLVKELKRLGYSDAEVSITKGGAMAVAVVDRYSNYDEAAALVKTLKSKHNIDALIKRKQ